MSFEHEEEIINRNPEEEEKLLAPPMSDIYFKPLSETQIEGVVQAAAGLYEMAAGAGIAILTAPTIAGPVAGAIFTAHGYDNLCTGLRQALTGEEIETVSKQVLSDVLGDKFATIVDAAMSVSSKGALIYLTKAHDLYVIGATGKELMKLGSTAKAIHIINELKHGLGDISSIQEIMKTANEEFIPTRDYDGSSAPFGLTFRSLKRARALLRGEGGFLLAEASPEEIVAALYMREEPNDLFGLGDTRENITDKTLHQALYRSVIASPDSTPEESLEALNSLAESGVFGDTSEVFSYYTEAASEDAELKGESLVNQLSEHLEEGEEISDEELTQKLNAILDHASKIRQNAGLPEPNKVKIINHVFGELEKIGQITGNKVVTTIGAAGRMGFEITGQINAIKNMVNIGIKGGEKLSKIAWTIAPNIANLATAGFAVLQLFGVFDGEDPEQQRFEAIMEMLNTIYQEILDFRREVKEQFDMLGIKIDQTLEKILDQFEYLYFELTVPVKHSLARQDVVLQQLTKMTERGVRDIQLMSFIETIDLIKRYQGDEISFEYMTEQEFIKMESILSLWIRKYSKNDSLTGSSYYVSIEDAAEDAATFDGYSQLLGSTRSNPLELHALIGFLFAYYQQKFDLGKVAISLANPSIFLAAVEAYQMLLKLPIPFNIEKHLRYRVSDINRLIKETEEQKTAIERFQNSALYRQLTEEIEADFERFIVQVGNAEQQGKNELRTAIKKNVEENNSISLSSDEVLDISVFDDPRDLIDEIDNEGADYYPKFAPFNLVPMADHCSGNCDREGHSRWISISEIASIDGFGSPKAFFRHHRGVSSILPKTMLLAERMGRYRCQCYYHQAGTNGACQKFASASTTPYSRAVGRHWNGLELVCFAHGTNVPLFFLNPTTQKDGYGAGWRSVDDGYERIQFGRNAYILGIRTTQLNTPIGDHEIFLVMDNFLAVFRKKTLLKIADLFKHSKEINALKFKLKLINAYVITAGFAKSNQIVLQTNAIIKTLNELHDTYQEALIQIENSAIPGDDLTFQHSFKPNAFKNRRDELIASYYTQMEAFKQALMELVVETEEFSGSLLDKPSTPIHLAQHKLSEIREQLLLIEETFVSGKAYDRPSRTVIYKTLPSSTSESDDEDERVNFYRERIVVEQTKTLNTIRIVEYQKFEAEFLKNLRNQKYQKARELKRVFSRKFGLFSEEEDLLREESIAIFNEQASLLIKASEYAQFKLILLDLSKIFPELDTTLGFAFAWLKEGRLDKTIDVLWQNQLITDRRQLNQLQRYLSKQPSIDVTFDDFSRVIQRGLPEGSSVFGRVVTFFRGEDTSLEENSLELPPEQIIRVKEKGDETNIYASSGASSLTSPIITLINGFERLMSVGIDGLRQRYNRIVGGFMQSEFAEPPFSEQQTIPEQCIGGSYTEQASSVELYEPPRVSDEGIYQTNVVCVPVKFVDEFTGKEQPVINCLYENEQIYYFLKTSERTGIMLRSERDITYGPIKLNARDYDKASCRVVTWNGRPSVHCDGEKMTVIYSQACESRPLENLGAQVALLAVGMQFAKKLYDRFISKSQIEEPLEKQYVNEAIYNEVLFEKFKELQAVKKRLKTDIEFVNESELPEQTKEYYLSEITYYLEEVWLDHWDTLCELRDRGAATRKEFSELTLDIDELRKQYNDDVVEDIQNIITDRGIEQETIETFSGQRQETIRFSENTHGLFAVQRQAMLNPRIPNLSIENLPGIRGRRW